VATALQSGEIDHLLERRDLVSAVVDGVLLTHVGQPLLGPQGLQLREGEVFGEPTGDRCAVDDFGGLSIGELRSRRHVGRRGHVVLMSRDEHVVLCRDQVWLDDPGDSVRVGVAVVCAVPLSGVGGRDREQESRMSTVAVAANRRGSASCMWLVPSTFGGFVHVAGRTPPEPGNAGEYVVPQVR
jgi:hypothetical protein